MEVKTMSKIYGGSKMNKDLQNEVRNYLAEAIDLLKNDGGVCWTYKLDDRLAICVGWEQGFGNELRDDVVQSKTDLDWAIVAAIKVWTSDDMRTDMKYINYPYYRDGDVIDFSVSITPNEDLDNLAKYFIESYNQIRDLEMTEDGCIIENPIE
jgi:hypothetical protein